MRVEALSYCAHTHERRRARTPTNLFRGQRDLQSIVVCAQVNEMCFDGRRRSTINYNICMTAPLPSTTTTLTHRHCAVFLEFSFFTFRSFWTSFRSVDFEWIVNRNAFARTRINFFYILHLNRNFFDSFYITLFAVCANLKSNYD